MTIRRSPPLKPLIFTIGYEGTAIEAFVDTLVNAGVEVLADVRALPLSRKPGFSKGALAAHLKSKKMLYWHFGALGDPKEGREAARGGRYADFRQIYSQSLRSEKAVVALEHLAELALTRSTCMMCFERDPLVCHRSMIADQLTGRGFAVTDLFVEASKRNALPRRYPREGATAAE